MAEPKPPPESLPSPHLLVVDDDDRLRHLLKRYLCNHGFSVTLASSPARARRYMKQIQFDLLIVDVMMPGEGGLDFVSSLRRDPLFRNMPILILSALGKPAQRIEGFEAGSNDYLAKPFEPRELLLRMQNLMDRPGSQASSPSLIETPEAGNITRFGNCRFDRHRQLLLRDNRPVKLAPGEQTLLHIFVERPGLALNRESLMHLCSLQGEPRTIDVLITRLRRKIEDNPKQPYYLVTKRGQGYMFVPD